MKLKINKSKLNCLPVQQLNLGLRTVNVELSDVHYPRPFGRLINVICSIPNDKLIGGYPYKVIREGMGMVLVQSCCVASALRMGTTRMWCDRRRFYNPNLGA